MGLDVGSAISLDPTQVVTGLGSAYLGYQGVKKTNESNAAIAAARNEFEMEEALKARTFSAEQQDRQFKYGDTQARLAESFAERMSSTAVQRRMLDMKKAGINPILAGKFDASTPAGSMGAGGIGVTAKANAHGYTAQNKIQGALDNLGTALSIQKLAAEAKKAGADADISQNMSRVTSFTGNVADKGNKGLSELEKFTNSLGTSIGSTAHDVVMFTRELMRKASANVKAAKINDQKKRGYGVGVRNPDTGEYSWTNYK